MNTYFKTRIETITDADFVSSIKPSDALSSVLSCSKTRDMKGLYRAIGAYHAGSFANEAGRYREGIVRRYADGAARKRLRKAAYSVIGGRIMAWDVQEVRFGKVFDFSINLGVTGTCGFHYMGWIKPVLDYHVLCGDRKCAEALNRIISQYYDQRKRVPVTRPGFHPVYYELGAWAKTHALLPIYGILLGENALDCGNIERLLKLFMGFGRSLYRLEQKGFRPGNWQLAGCEALFRLGSAFPEFREAAAWRKCAEQLLVRHARDGFHPDGGHKERSWSYGWMSLNAMVEFYTMAERSGCLEDRARRSIKSCLKRGFKWFAASTSPSRHMLNYGDGGLLSADAVFKKAGSLFPELKRAGGLMGVDRSRSCIMRKSGYAFMRCEDSRDAPFMSVNFGRYFNSHSHNDILDFSLWRYGEPLVNEVGGFGSYDSPRRPFFCSDVAHNQTVIEHVPMNRCEHEGRDVMWSTSERADLFSAWHEAYGWAGQQIRIYRQIVFVKPLYWIIHDTIDGRGMGFQAANYIHAPRPFKLCGDGMARVSGTAGCLVMFAEHSKIRILEAAVDYCREEYTGSNPLELERHRLVARSWNETGDRTPVTFTMLLMPFKGRIMPGAGLKPVRCTGANAFKVDLNGRNDVVVFNPERRRWRMGSRTSDSILALRSGGRWQCMMD